MNAEITIVQTRFVKLYEEQRAYLKGKPRQFIEDLLHESEDLRHNESFSIRASAEINRAACTMILEEATQ